MNHYDINLDKNNANHVPLTPLTFLQRAKDVYPDYEAIVYGIEATLGMKYIKER